MRKPGSFCLNRRRHSIRAMCRMSGRFTHSEGCESSWQSLVVSRQQDHGHSLVVRCHVNSIDLSLANIEKAARSIDPVFLNGPQFIDEELCVALGRRTIVKVETANP